MDTIEKDGKKYAFYEIELFNYGDHNYSLIQIEYQNESDLSEFVEGKNKSKETANEIGDASSNTVKKTGEGLEKAGKNLKESASDKE
ncbi:1347_t:CDS:2 [Entrophospora sp. SA101]|nr:6940_t:CDS:2 [Entrophospora sp. SA101]CAJ0748135.1 1347_t:CDS:2 [Entrophospora sp. SA101]CAJ0875020.1 6843_t:CDS:2 [Entrophospora sp. SA101]